jgi:hypothetical protein
MATLRTGLPDNFLNRLAFLEDTLFDEIKVEDGVVGSVVKVREMGNRPFVNTTTIASFGRVPIKAEGADVAYDDLAQGYDKKYTADTYELAFQTSKEALDDEQEELVSDAARALGNSLTFTYNSDHADLYNNGFTSTTGSPDGAAIFSASHPLIGGGNGSNLLGTAADLSVQSLRDLLNVIADTVDDAGKLLHWRPSTLLVPQELSWLAKELVRSTERPDTADRAINAFRDDNLNVVVWPYLTDPDAWFLLASPDMMNIRSYWREKPNVLHDWSFESSSMKVKIRARWIRGWSDYKGVAGTPGA